MNENPGPTPPPLGLCDVCHVEPAVGVASSAVGPMSMAYGANCIQAHAEPEWAFEYLYLEVGYRGENLSDWVNELHTYANGEYVPWKAWKALRQLQDVAVSAANYPGTLKALNAVYKNNNDISEEERPGFAGPFEPALMYWIDKSNVARLSGVESVFKSMSDEDLQIFASSGVPYDGEFALMVNNFIANVMNGGMDPDPIPEALPPDDQTVL